MDLQKNTEAKLQDHLAKGNSIYVSVTGLSFKKPWHFFMFVVHAVPSKIQSDKAEGNLFSETKTIGGVRHKCWPFSILVPIEKPFQRFLGFLLAKLLGISSTKHRLGNPRWSSGDCMVETMPIQVQL
jgi:hypothetical protein